MRQQAMSSKMIFNRPIPVNRLVSSIADSKTPLLELVIHFFFIDHAIKEAQVNTQEYGRRPYGVGFLVIGQDNSGPHLYEFSPSGNSYEYYAMSIGARSQSAKTYLEKHYESFVDCESATSSMEASNNCYGYCHQAHLRILYNTDCMHCERPFSKTRNLMSTIHPLE